MLSARFRQFCRELFVLIGFFHCLKTNISGAVNFFRNGCLLWEVFVTGSALKSLSLSRAVV